MTYQFSEQQIEAIQLAAQRAALISQKHDGDYEYHNAPHNSFVGKQAGLYAMEMGANEGSVQLVEYAGLTHDLMYRGSSKYLNDNPEKVAEKYPRWAQKIQDDAELKSENSSRPLAEATSAEISVQLLRTAAQEKQTEFPQEIYDDLRRAIDATALGPANVQARALGAEAGIVTASLTAADLTDSVRSPLDCVQNSLKLAEEHDQGFIRNGM